jgi:hypothetical protein
MLVSWPAVEYQGKTWISDDFNDEDEEINKLFYGE